MTTAVAVPCPTCNRAPGTQVDDFGITVYCSNCYDADCVGDPPEFVSTSPTGHGRTLSDAIDAWNMTVEDMP